MLEQHVLRLQVPVYLPVEDDVQGVNADPIPWLLTINGSMSSPECISGSECMQAFLTFVSRTMHVVPL